LFENVIVKKRFFNLEKDKHVRIGKIKVMRCQINSGQVEESGENRYGVCMVQMPINVHAVLSG